MKPVLILVCVLIVFGGIVFFFMTKPSTLSIKTITVDNTTVVAEVADTDATREQGLSDRTSLPEGKGMLFVFPQESMPGFWMKDMNFAIDMIFAAQDGTIITIDSDVSPDTYHQTPPQVFYPSAPILYVVEVPAGFTAAHSVAVGDKIVVQ